ncbi:hypothetical protein, partial [Oceanithermus profundus]
MSRVRITLLALLGLLLASPVAAEEPLSYAEQLIRSGEYALAEIALEKQIADHPVAAARLLSDVYLFEGDLDRAQHWLERAREAGLDDAAYYWQKGRIESARANWPAAWAGCRNATSPSPPSAYS